MLYKYANIFLKASQTLAIAKKGDSIYGYKGHLYSVNNGDTDIGEVGIFEFNNDGRPYSHIEINKEFRGKGYAKPMYDAIMDKHALNEVYAIIQHKNIPSLKSHQKIGFEKIESGSDRDVFILKR